jgi:hypothetical protein
MDADSPSYESEGEAAEGKQSIILNELDAGGDVKQKEIPTQMT